MTSAQRQPSFPDLPAIGEIVQGFESTAWFGVFGPANLPANITNKLNAAIVAAMTNPGMRKQLQNEGAMPVGNSTAEFAAFVRDDVQRWAPIREAVGCEARLRCTAIIQSNGFLLERYVDTRCSLPFLRRIIPLSIGVA